MMLLVIWLIYIYISCCYKLYLVFYSLFLFKKIYRGLFNFDVEKYKYYGCDLLEIFRVLYS